MIANQVLEILQEGDDYIAIHKPSGIHSVKTTKSNNISVVDILPKELHKLKACSPNPLDGGIVNRLDFETSGLLIIAKSRSSWEYLHNQYKSGNVLKEYYCIVEPGPHFPAEKTDSLPENAPVSLEGYLGSSSRTSPRMRWFKESPATKYRARFISLEILPLSFLAADQLLLKVITTYGIRHQIRAACSYLGSPLIGDKLYGSQKVLENLNLQAFFLHSHTVHFFDHKNQRIAFRSDKLPEPILAATKTG